ncbi:MAG: hypothetical protein AAF698_05425, partial [Pseudomonadota bacterium]
MSEPKERKRKESTGKGSVRGQIRAAFGLSIALTFASAGVGLVAFQSISDAFDTLRDERVPEVRRASDLLGRTDAVARALERVERAPTPGALTAATEAYEGRRRALARAVDTAPPAAAEALGSSVEALQAAGSALASARAELFEANAAKT